VFKIHVQKAVLGSLVPVSTVVVYLIAGDHCSRSCVILNLSFIPEVTLQLDQ